jgi:predicted aspartyl protease
VAIWSPVGLPPSGVVDSSSLGPPHRVVRAVIDTGCTRTTIRPDIAAELSLPVHDKAQAYVANSKLPQQTFTVRAVLGLPRPGLSYLIRPFSLMVSDGHDEMLFGMDALRGGILTVNCVQGTWRWEVLKRPANP